METKGLKVKASPFFKIHRKQGKNYQGLNLRKQFGFLPEQIIIERLSSRNNVIRIVAVLTKEEIKKEDALRAKITGKKK